MEGFADGHQMFLSQITCNRYPEGKALAGSKNVRDYELFTATLRPSFYRCKRKMMARVTLRPSRNRQGQDENSLAWQCRVSSLGFLGVPVPAVG